MSAPSIPASMMRAEPRSGPRRPFWTVAALALATLFAWGCSENGSGDSVVPTIGTEPAGGPLQIEARDTSFVPERFEAELGDIVIELTNEGSEQHSLTVYEDESYESPIDGGVIDVTPPGEMRSASFSITEPSVLRFRCEIHPDQMDGILFVGTTEDP